MLVKIKSFDIPDEVRGYQDNWDTYFTANCCGNCSSFVVEIDGEEEIICENHYPDSIEWNLVKVPYRFFSGKLSQRKINKIINILETLKSQYIYEIHAFKPRYFNI